MNTTTSSPPLLWTITEFGQGPNQQRSIDLPQRDLIVGRACEADLTISCPSVSKRHARLLFRDDCLVVEDLGSTNGTRLNGERIERSLVAVGDLLQFGNALYRVSARRAPEYDKTNEESIANWANTLIQFDRMLNERAVVPHFQPILDMNSREIVAYELLARSDFKELAMPALMFAAAERLGQQARLSELLREEGTKIAVAKLDVAQELFLNTHPSEVINDRLIASLQDLRAEYPQAKINIEIHEAAMTDAKTMTSFRHVLGELNMRLSYDDFGAGQGRLLELGEVPPDVLKFDMKLIRSIDAAPASRQELLAKLVRITKDLGATALAEGVETEAEHQTCCQLGFQLGQGFHYGRPQPA